MVESSDEESAVADDVERTALDQELRSAAMAGDLAWVQRLMAGGSASGVKTNRVWRPNAGAGASLDEGLLQFSLPHHILCGKSI